MVDVGADMAARGCAVSMHAVATLVQACEACGAALKSRTVSGGWRREDMRLALLHAAAGRWACRWRELDASQCVHGQSCGMGAHQWGRIRRKGATKSASGSDGQHCNHAASTPALCHHHLPGTANQRAAKAHGTYVYE